MTNMLNLSRRTFIVGTGAAGLTIGVLAACSKPAEPDVSGLEANPEVNAWVHIGHDDIVTVRIARSEMGQGTLTGLAQLVAEELECDWDKVVTEYPTPGQNLARERGKPGAARIPSIRPRRRSSCPDHANRSGRE